MNGVVIVHKESGYTSRDVVNILNKIFKTKKIGHTGTLDPMASGVLVVCIGKYTKLVNRLTSYEKEYIATIKLGVKTDTLDSTGTILEKEDPKKYTEAEIKEVLNTFLGKSLQEIPLYAAVKVHGKRLYEYARENIEITPPKREIEVKNINLLNYQKDEITFSCLVSKGTYIRSLIRDICKELHSLGTMSKLERIKQGNFTIEESFTLEQIKQGKYKLLNLEDLFSCPRYSLSDIEYQKVKNGNILEISNTSPELLFLYNKKVVAVYEKKDAIYKPYLVL